MLSALDLVTGRLALHCRWSTNVSSLALAMEAASSVLAAGEGSTRIGGALVDVDANRALSNESLQTEALGFDTFGVVDAIEV